MITPNGHVQMLGPGEYTLPASAPDGSVLVHGTEVEIRAIAERVRLGARELEKRSVRRRLAKRSRRRNR